MAKSIRDLQAAFEALDARLKPIAKRQVDVSDPSWSKKLAEGPHPLDAAGVREVTESLVRELTEGYAEADDAWRERVRELLRQYDSLAWAIASPGDRATPWALREELILFSMLDQGRDPRDAKLWLEALCREGGAHGEAFDAALREVGRLSSVEDRHGWGSTRQWLEETTGTANLPDSEGRK